MSNRLREEVGKYSTWYVCDEHGWDFTNVNKDVCPVCYGESLAEERIIEMLENDYGIGLDFDISSRDKIYDYFIELIKGKKANTSD